MNIKKILKEELLKESIRMENYMFFQNLKEIKENIEELLSMDQYEVDRVLSDGHDWASEHMATAKDDIEEVTSFLKHRKGGLEENVKTVNFKDLGDVWNAEYHYHKDDDKQPYEIVDRMLVPVPRNRYRGHGKYYYLTKERVEELNDIKQQIIDLESLYKSKLRTEVVKEDEKKDDRCTRIAKRKYDVWPSAYASGAVVRCRKGEIWKDEK